MPYHVKDGLYFDRLQNGDVKIVKRADEKPESEIVFEQIISSETWLTILVMFKSLASDEYVDPMAR